MLSVILFAVAVLATLLQVVYKAEKRKEKILEIFLGYVFLFAVGAMSLIAAYMHLFVGEETAQNIGWAPHSPFQKEIGMANLSYGVLGVLAYWFRGAFWDALAIGWSILLLGCFVIHLISFFTENNTAPYNIGVFVWFYDLILPLMVLSLLGFLRAKATIKASLL